MLRSALDDAGWGFAVFKATRPRFSWAWQCTPRDPLYQRRKKLTLFLPFYVSRQKRFAFRLRRGLRLYPEALSRYSRGRYGGRSRGPYTSDHKSHFQSPLVLYQRR